MKPFDASWRVPAHACAANFRGYRRAFRNNIQLTEIRYRVTISLPFHLRYRAARKESKWIPPPSSRHPLSRLRFSSKREFVRSFVSTQDGRDHHLYLFSVSPSFGKKTRFSKRSIVLLVITRRTGVDLFGWEGEEGGGKSSVRIHRGK